MQSVAVDNAVEYLKGAGSGQGGQAYAQLTAALAKLIEDKPAAAGDLLELALEPSNRDATVKEIISQGPTVSAADAARGVSTVSLFGAPDLGVDPDSGEPIEPEPLAEFESEDVMADAALFDALGVGLGRAEMTGVALAARKLGGGSQGCATVRFFGKFFGLESSYYVFETTLNDPPEIPEAPEGEVPFEAGTGANNYVYYVCSFLGGPFTQLPYVTPDQIKAARSVKKYLTGKLDAPVSTYPAFPGNEANYLRAQITRIACTTVCAPVSSFLADEDGAVEKNEEWEGVKDREGSTASSWCHRYPHLKNQGRCELFKRDGPEDEDEPFEWTPDELEEGPPPLAPLDVDSVLDNSTMPAWTGVSQSVHAGVPSQVGGMRSNVWPGAFCACKSKHFCNVYVGWGLKYGGYTPPAAPAMAPEFDPESLVENLELPPPPPPPDAEEADE